MNPELIADLIERQQENPEPIYMVEVFTQSGVDSEHIKNNYAPKETADAWEVPNTYPFLFYDRSKGCFIGTLFRLIKITIWLTPLVPER